MGGTQNVSFLGRRYFKLPILSCPRIPPATQATRWLASSVQLKFEVSKVLKDDQLYQNKRDIVFIE